jgi:hypothetical protein
MSYTQDRSHAELLQIAVDLAARQPAKLNVEYLAQRIATFQDAGKDEVAATVLDGAFYRPMTVDELRRGKRHLARAAKVDQWKADQWQRDAVAAQAKEVVSRRHATTVAAMKILAPR